MKRFCYPMVLTALLAGLWQWFQLYRLEARSGVLAAQIKEAQAMSAASHSKPTTTDGKGIISKASDTTALPEAVPVEVAEFLLLAGEISRIEAALTAGADRRELRQKITALFRRLPVTPVPQLKAILEKLPSSDISSDGREQISSLIMNILAESDPAAAAAYALQNKSRAGALKVALRTWAKKDPAAAAAWLEGTVTGGGLAPGSQTEQLRLLIFPQQIAADPGGAVVDLMTQFQPANLGDLLAETAGLLTTPEQRGAFFKRLSQLPGLPPEALGKFLQETGRASSVEAATALLKETGAALPPERFDEMAVLATTSRIDSNTPAHADWLLQNLRGPDRQPAITKLIENWTRADFNAAATWLKNQTASADHDTAIAAFAPLVAAKEPPSAVDWAATIADPAHRSSVLATLYQSWHHQSPAEAADYFREKGLTPLPP